MVIVGALTPMPGFLGFNIIWWNRAVGGSAIGGIPETQEMLDFCAAKDIYPDVEFIRMDQVNEAYERLLKNDVRYRFVIDMSQRPVSEAVHPVPESFKARIGPDELEALSGEALTPIRTRFWLEQARRLDWYQAAATGRRLVLRRRRFPHQLVRGRAAQPVRQLPRPAPRGAWRPDGASSSRPTSRGTAIATPIASCTRRPAASRTC